MPEKPLRYGLFDAESKCWVGNTHGPLSWEDLTLALAAATVVSEQVDRLIIAKPLERQPLRLRDEIATKMTTYDAIRTIEGRSASN